MIELTQQQRDELSASPESPATVLDPETMSTYVLLPRDVYEHLREIADEDNVRLMAPLLASLDPEDWEDASAYAAKP